MIEQNAEGGDSVNNMFHNCAAFVGKRAPTDRRAGSHRGSEFGNPRMRFTPPTEILILLRLTPTAKLEISPQLIRLAVCSINGQQGKRLVGGFKY